MNLITISKRIYIIFKIGKPHLREQFLICVWAKIFFSALVTFVSIHLFNLLKYVSANNKVL